MNYHSILTKLCFLLIQGDGAANEKEMAIAKQMIKTEGLSPSEFEAQMQLLKVVDKNALLLECVKALKKLEIKVQIRAMAWLCLLANADGFMEKEEWQLIYRLYHKELALPLAEIFAVQKELNKRVWESNTMLL